MFGGQVYFGAEGLVFGQADGDFAMARGDDQAFGDATELSGVADIQSIEKNGSAVGIHRDFYFRGHCRHYEPSVFDHPHGHELLFSGMQHYVLREVHVAVLADGDFMFAGKQEDLL